MPYNFIKNVILNESTPSKNLELLPLPYSKGDLEPAISEDTINYHYSKLAKAYVDRYNDREGDLDFNEAGAFLHNILFPQYHKAEGKNDLTDLQVSLSPNTLKHLLTLKKSLVKKPWAYRDQVGFI